MTDKAENEEIVQVEVEAETPEVVTEGSETPPEQATTAAEDGDDVQVSIDGVTPDPEPQEKAPEWVRELRKKNREDQKRIKELEARLQTATAGNKPAELGKKPTLDDHDYDTDKYEAALASWYERKREHDQQEVQRQKAVEEQTREWSAKLDAYAKAKSELKASDFEEAEGLIQDNFSQTQQGVIISGADNPAILVLALGRNPKKAAELAAIKDPVKFAFAIAKLETQLKVTNRKAPPAPEKTITGSAPKSGTVDSTLERLEAEAERTGDRSKVIAHKRSLRAKT